MSKHTLGFILLLSSFFYNCNPPRQMASVGYPELHRLFNYKKILVIGIVPAHSQWLRYEMETSLVGDLSRFNLYGIASSKFFGDNSFQQFSDEENYIPIIDQNIDAIVIVALVDRNSREKSRFSLQAEHSATYYYNRVHAYQQFQESFPPIRLGAVGQLQFECIVFDTHRLQLVTYIQTKRYDGIVEKDIIVNFSRLIVNELQR